MITRLMIFLLSFFPTLLLAARTDPLSESVLGLTDYMTGPLGIAAAALYAMWIAGKYAMASRSGDDFDLVKSMTTYVIVTGMWFGAPSIVSILVVT
jgi:hypothetical protein